MNEMQLLTRETFEDMRSGATVVEQDHFGEKVLLLADGTYMKLFRRKSWFSKTTLHPPAQRFAENAACLARLSIPCPRILGTYRLKSPYRSVVHYVPLAGSTLRVLLKTADCTRQKALLGGLGDFIAELHDKGVYFRSLHFGNIVETPDQHFGLIDISDMRCLNRPLSRSLRRRNYEHLLRYKDDWNALPAQLRETIQRDIVRR